MTNFETWQRTFGSQCYELGLPFAASAFCGLTRLWKYEWLHGDHIRTFEQILSHTSHRRTPLVCVLSEMVSV